MNKYIVVCGCSNVPEKAKMAFSIAFPRQDLPEVFRGADKIQQLAAEHANTNLSKYLLAIAKKSGQYAYYIEEQDGDIFMNYDLLKGKRVG